MVTTKFEIAKCLFSKMEFLIEYQTRIASIDRSNYFTFAFTHFK